MSKNDRKGKVITIGEDLRKRIPQLFSNVYKIEQTAVKDGEDLDEDETLRLHTLRTVFVEGESIVEGGKAVNVNGEFDIPLERHGLGDSDKDLREEVYVDREEAVDIWEKLTNAQIRRCREKKEQIDNTLIALETSLSDRQF
jgi:hypothetical protein